jgi:PAS domain S-box-containing protein
MYTHINGGHGRVPVGQFKIGLIASERNPHLTNSVIGDLRVNDQEWAKREGMVAFAGYPLLIEDKLVGVMAMFARQPLMASTLQAMESVSNVIAASILRKRINDEKQRETERSRAILETALDCIITMDHEGKILEFNPAAERTFGYTRSAIIGKELAALIIPPHLRERHRRGLAHYLTTGHSPLFGKRIDITAMRSDGSEFPVELMISPMSIGERATFTGFIRDISERKRAEAHIQRNIERMEALREIEKSITSTLDLNTVLNVLLEKIDIFFAKSSAAIVRLFDRDTGQLEPVAARNIEISEWIAAMRGVQDNPKSYAGVVIEQRAPLVIDNLQTDSRTQNPHFFGEHGLISYAGVPLIAKGEVLGVLGIYTKEQHCFSSEEIELLMILAGHTAIAIHNAQLFQTIEASKQQLASMNQFLEHALNKLGSLYTAMTPLALSESLGEMVNAIIERLIEATGADAALIRIWDRDTGKYPVIGHRGYTDDFVEGLRPERADGAIQWVIKHGEPIIAPDLSSEVRFRGKRQVALGFQSSTILPVRVHGDIRGVIQLSSRKQRYFDDEQKDYLMAVARQMSVALENRELFYNLQASRNELERANKVKDEFLNVMSHELRTPLSVVVGYSTMLLEQQLGPLTKEQEQTVDVIQRNSKELFTMIDSIMNATKIEAGSMIAEKGAVSPGELLAELKVIYDFPTGKKIRFEWRFSQTLRSLWTDGRKLRQILTNLINNAVKFTDEGSIIISAEEKLEGLEDDEGCHRSWIQFRVSDSGIGIPAEERDKIFERFHQVDSSAARSFEGVGLGLYIVKSFTEMLNGRVSVSSAVGHGSTFTVRIPYESIPIARGNCYIKEESTIGPPAIAR